MTPPRPRKVGEVQRYRMVLGENPVHRANICPIPEPDYYHGEWVRYADLAPLLAELEALRVDSLRYKWLANRVLACDYGDNDKGDGSIGWRIRFDLLAHDGERQPDFMHGPSIDAAIDAALALRDKESGE